MIAADVALAFNTANSRKTWGARPYASDGQELVHFTAPTNLVTLILECDTGKFAVRFTRTQAAWGDYVTAIARSLHVVLSTLKAAGLPFEAPEDIEGIEIVATVGGKATYVRWPQQTPLTVASATMPELRGDEPAIMRGLLSDAAIVS